VRSGASAGKLIPDWLAGSTAWSSYNEIHMGTNESAAPWLEISRETATSSASGNSIGESIPDGAIAPDGRIWGCYLHGIFASSAFRHAWLRSLGWQEITAASHNLENERFARELRRLTDTVEAALDIHKLEEIVWGN
jgi:adenosylcobyric acid synthase